MVRGNFERPDWKRLIADIEAGKVGCVIAKDMSRIGRDYLQTGVYTEVLFREKGVRPTWMGSTNWHGAFPRSDYVENPEKTNGGDLVTACQRNPSIADQEFLFSKRQYAVIIGRERKDHDVIAYHLRQSFKLGEITPEFANKIGYDLAMSLTKGKHAFIVCTHVDKRHIHSHTQRDGKDGYVLAGERADRPWKIGKSLRCGSPEVQ